MASPQQYNLRNPAVKRIMQEVKELEAVSPEEQRRGGFVASPLESDMFEWQFAIAGPPGTEFEGGTYLGRVQLPAEYPFKPPTFSFLSATGRFEVGVKICLSISQYHPEHWQPSWSIRTALTALSAFMASPAEGALGSLECDKAERRRLAAESRRAPPNAGAPDRQALAADLHSRLLAFAPLLPPPLPPKGAAPMSPAVSAPGEATGETPLPVPTPAPVTPSAAVPAPVHSPPPAPSPRPAQSPEPAVPAATPAEPLDVPDARAMPAVGAGAAPIGAGDSSKHMAEDIGFMLLLGSLATVILALLLRKLLRSLELA